MVRIHQCFSQQAVPDVWGAHPQILELECHLQTFNNATQEYSPVDVRTRLCLPMGSVVSDSATLAAAQLQLVGRSFSPYASDTTVNS
eukprot:1552640-Pleurochrysis_carterae.AAC.4